MSRSCPNSVSGTQRKEAGSVLVLALLTLLALTLMGVGLGYVGSSQIDLARSQATQDNTLSAAETGVDHAINWLRGQIATALPSAPQTFNSTPLTSGTSTDAGLSTNKLSTTTYSARLEPLASGAGTAGSGIGSDISNPDALTSTRYYKITGTSSQSGTTGVKVEVIVSVTP